MKQEENINSGQELKDNLKKTKIELLGLLIIIFPFLVFIILETISDNKLMNEGKEIRGVIVGYDSSVRVRSTYNYLFCIDYKHYYGTLTVDSDKHGWFVFGDIITIIYNPSNPKKNGAAIWLFKKKEQRLEKYKNEIPINFKNIPELYKFRRRGLSERYNWVDIREKYPISKETFPCLPPEYYGEF